MNQIEAPTKRYATPIKSRYRLWMICRAFQAIMKMQNATQMLKSSARLWKRR